MNSGKKCLAVENRLSPTSPSSNSSVRIANKKWRKKQLIPRFFVCKDHMRMIVLKTQKLSETSEVVLPSYSLFNAPEEGWGCVAKTTINRNNSKVCARTKLVLQDRYVIETLPATLQRRVRTLLSYLRNQQH